MLKKFKYWFLHLFRKKWDPGVAIEYVYTDRFGVRYFQLKEISQISYRRSIAAEIATRQAEYCLTKESLLKLIDQMRDYANEGNIVDLFVVLNEIQQRAMYAGEEETLLHLASVYFFGEGENIEIYDSTEQLTKISRWKQDESAKSFFLQRAFERTRNYLNMSEQDILRSLMEYPLNQETLNHILGSPSLVISTK